MEKNTGFAARFRAFFRENGRKFLPIFAVLGVALLYCMYVFLFSGKNDKKNKPAHGDGRFTVRMTSVDGETFSGKYGTDVWGPLELNEALHDFLTKDSQRTSLELRTIELTDPTMPDVTITWDFDAAVADSSGLYRNVDNASITLQSEGKTLVRYDVVRNSSENVNVFLADTNGDDALECIIDHIPAAEYGNLADSLIVVYDIKNRKQYQICKCLYEDYSEINVVEESEQVAAIGMKRVDAGWNSLGEFWHLKLWTGEGDLKLFSSNPYQKGDEIPVLALGSDTVDVLFEQADRYEHTTKTLRLGEYPDYIFSLNNTGITVRFKDNYGKLVDSWQFNTGSMILQNAYFTDLNKDGKREFVGLFLRDEKVFGNGAVTSLLGIWEVYVLSFGDHMYFSQKAQVIPVGSGDIDISDGIRVTDRENPEIKCRLFALDSEQVDWWPSAFINGDVDPLLNVFVCMESADDWNTVHRLAAANTNVNEAVRLRELPEYTFFIDPDYYWTIVRWDGQNQPKILFDMKQSMSYDFSRFESVVFKDYTGDGIPELCCSAKYFLSTQSWVIDVQTGRIMYNVDDRD